MVEAEHKHVQTCTHTHTHTHTHTQVYMRSHGYIEEFGKENVIFLTSDSPNVLTGTYTTIVIPTVNGTHLFV